MFRSLSYFLLIGATAIHAQNVATVQVTRTPSGPAIPKDFVGLSIQQSFALNFFGPSTNSNTVVFNLLRNLGGGNLRIGGATADSDCWAGATPPVPAFCLYTLTAADFESWSYASEQTGWPMLLGVSLAQNASPGAPQYILSELTSSLLPIIQSYPKATLMGLELGNELNLYALQAIYRPPTYTLAGQTSDLLSYMTTLKANASTKNITLAAPAYYDPVTSTFTTQIDPLIASVNSCAGCNPSNLGLVTVHYYPLSTSKGVPTIAQLMNPALIQQVTQIYQQAASTLTGNYKLNLQIDETNSTIPDPGQTGVSDVQASAIWALDYALEMAHIGVRRINFHVHQGSYYDPIVVSSPTPGVFSTQVMPEYYAMYAFAAAKGQQFLPVAVTSSANIRAYALSTCATCAMTIYLINKDLSASGPVQVSLSAPGTTATYLELAAPSLASYAQNVTYGGVQFSNSTGLLTGPAQTATVHPDANGNYTVNLDNAAAGILTIQP